MVRIILLFTIFLFQVLHVSGQLMPGFDAQEYRQLIGLLDEQYKEFDPLKERIGVDPRFKLVYRSPEVGLENQWDFWVTNDSIGVISIRGTTPNKISWLANFYGAMIPAIGTLQLNDSTRFNYKLAQDERATVHVGWTVCLGFIAPGILQKVKSAYAQGIRSFIICGHSQGAALSALVRSYLEYVPNLPGDIRFKTYCSAGPKVGNQYYSYDFDFITRGGWAFRIVNISDWVPEVGFSLQTRSDIKTANPFADVETMVKTQNWVVRMYLKSQYRKMDKSSKKAAKRFRESLGTMVGKQVKKALPQFREPEYANSMNFTPAGVPIIFQNDSSYKQKYNFTGKNIFVHHGLRPYYDLAENYIYLIK